MIKKVHVFKQKTALLSLFCSDKSIKSTLKEKNIGIYIFSALKNSWLNPEKIKEIMSQDFQFVPDSLSLYTNNISGVLHNQDNFINNKNSLINTSIFTKV